MASKIRKMGDYLTRLIQLAIAALAAESVTQITKAVQKEAGDDTPPASSDQGQQEATQVAPNADDGPQAAPDLEQIFSDLTETQKDAVKDIGRSLASGSIDVSEALALLSEIDTEAFAEALEAGLENYSNPFIDAVYRAEAQLFQAPADQETDPSAPTPQSTSQDQSPTEETLELPEPIQTPQEPENLAPTLDYVSTFENGVFTFDFVGRDPEGGPVTIHIDGVETNQITFTLEEMANNPDPFPVTVTDAQGAVFEAVLSPPEVADTEGNQAPIPLPASFSVTENENLTETVQAYDAEDGLIDLVVDFGSFDFEAIGSQATQDVIFADSEGATALAEIGIEILDDDFDHRVDSPIEPLVAVLSHHPNAGVQFSDWFPVNEGFDFATALHHRGHVQYALHNQDGVLLDEITIDHRDTGQSQWDFSFDGSTGPSTTAIQLQWMEITTANAFTFFLGLEPEIYT